MKNIISLLTVFMLMFSTALMAQPQRGEGNPERMKQMREEMQAQCGEDEECRQQMREQRRGQFQGAEGMGDKGGKGGKPGARMGQQCGDDEQCKEEMREKMKGMRGKKNQDNEA